MTEGQGYQDGQIVNGHRYNAKANAWEPLPPQTASSVITTSTGSPIPGTDIPQTAAAQAPVMAQGANGLAIAGFVLGLLGLLGSWIPLLNFAGILMGIVGVVLAAVGLARSRKVGSGKGLAIAGLILGGLAIIVAVVVNAAFAKSVGDTVGKATSTDVSAPAASGGGANAASDVGVSRDKPAPIGSAITGDDWTVKINSVSTVKADSLGQKPKAGSTLLVINMTATYNGNDPQGQSAWANVKYVTADGSTIDSSDGLFIADKSFDSLKTLYSGASVTGDKILQVPTNWQSGVLAVKPGLLSDDTFVAVK